MWFLVGFYCNRYKLDLNLKQKLFKFMAEIIYWLAQAAAKKINDPG